MGPKGYGNFRRFLPKSFAYAKEHGWTFDGQGKKTSSLSKGKVKVFIPITPSDADTDKIIIRKMQRADEEIANASAKETDPSQLRRSRVRNTS